MKSTGIKKHGGNSYTKNWILSHFPTRDSYITYAESHLGGGAVLFAHDPEGKSEVVNDIDYDLTNFWRVLQNPELRDELIRRLALTPFSQAVFEDAAMCARSAIHGDDVALAAAFFIRNRQSRQGLGKEFATMSKTRTRRAMNEQVSAWLSAIEGLPEFHERLQQVVIFNEDALKFIPRMDDPKTLFYCDPPYLHETRTHRTSYGEHEMTVDDHRKLLHVLSAIKGRFLLSGYPSELYDTHAAVRGWRCERKVIDNKASSAKTKERKIECLWMNY